MKWLDDIRVTAGKDSFTSIVDMVEPLLTRCAASSERGAWHRTNLAFVRSWMDTLSPLICRVRLSRHALTCTHGKRSFTGGSRTHQMRSQPRGEPSVAFLLKASPGEPIRRAL